MKPEITYPASGETALQGLSGAGLPVFPGKECFVPENGMRFAVSPYA